MRPVLSLPSALAIAPVVMACGSDQRCERAGQCVSGLCVDNVCSDAECLGMCESCTLAGLEGLCSHVPSGQPNPGGLCVDGSCDGEGGCVRKDGAFCSMDAECESGFCTDQTCCDKRCDQDCLACDVVGREGQCSLLDGVEDGNCMGSVICRDGMCVSTDTTATCLDDDACPQEMLCVEDSCR